VNGIANGIPALALALALLLVTPRPAPACGPGHHAREASRTLMLLGELQPEWAARAQVPHSLEYLHLGSALGPDFQWALRDYLDFGHSVELGYGLMDLADQEGDDLHRMFALGHIAHLASDPACEQFIQPSLFASAPVGIFDMWQGEGGNQAEQGSAQEAYGDLITGDWDALVDMLYGFHLDGSEAQARFDEVFTWYCEHGKELTGGWADCPGGLAAFKELLTTADGILGNMTRDKAHQFIHTLLDKPLDKVADLYATGLMSSLMGASADKSDIFESEFARFKASPLTDPSFWALYDQQLADLGPRWALERYLTRPPDAWPGWEGNALVCGNVESVMRFGPDDFEVQTGLIVDGLWWRNAEGQGVAQVTPDMQGAPLVAHVRFYSSLPFAGVVRAVVRKDAAGADHDLDSVTGEASAELAIDPTQYIHTPRTELDVPFTADPKALGYYLELYADDGDKPFFTTSWDRIWFLDDPALVLPMREYRKNFGTYGYWPPSLPLDPPDVQDGWLFVYAYDASTGKAVPGATVVSADEALGGLTGANGLAVFPDVIPQAISVSVSADWYEPAVLEPADLAAGQSLWLEAALTPLPVDPEPEEPNEKEPEFFCDGDGSETLTESASEAAAEYVTETAPETAPETETVTGTDADTVSDTGTGTDAAADTVSVAEESRSGGGCSVDGGRNAGAAWLLLLLLVGLGYRRAHL
jgi:hypothetical protein